MFSTPAKFRLTVATETHRFGRHEPEAEARLIRLLKQQESDTQLLDIRHPRDIMLNAEAALTTGYRFSSLAMKQICNHLGRGLGLLVDDLCRPPKTLQPEPGLAIKLINDLIRARFETLVDKVLILDAGSKVVEGVVGPRYVRLPNLELLQMVQDFVRKNRIPTDFNEAAISGRRLMLRFSVQGEVFSVPTERETNEPFFGGFHFANSEVGDCAVRAALVLIRQWCDNKAVGSYLDGGRLIHRRGPAFERGLSQLLEKLKKKVSDAIALRPYVLRLIQTKLGLGEDPTSDKRRLDELSSRLRQAGLPGYLADHAITQAVTQGSYDSNYRPSWTCSRWADGPRQWLEARNVYDVFNALTAMAKKESLEVQEHVERLAYQLLTGKVILR